MLSNLYNEDEEQRFPEWLERDPETGAMPDDYAIVVPSVERPGRFDVIMQVRTVSIDD